MDINVTKTFDLGKVLDEEEFDGKPAEFTLVVPAGIAMQVKRWAKKFNGKRFNSFTIIFGLLDLVRTFGGIKVTVEIFEKK